MKRRSLYLFLSLGLVLLAAAAILYPDLGFRFVVEPAARIVWLISRTFLAIDQVVFWTVLLVVVYIVGLRMVPALHGHTHPPAYQERVRIENLPAEWEALILSANETPEGRRALLRHLEALRSSVEDRDPNGDRTPIVLPPIETVIEQRLDVLRRRLPGFLRARTSPQQAYTDLEQAVEQVLHNLEMKLEPKDGTTTTARDD